MLIDNANYLSQLGQYVYNADLLMGFELSQAAAHLPLQSTSAALDMKVNSPGVPLVFGRMVCHTTWTTGMAIE